MAEISNSDAVMADRVGRLDRYIFGNGQPSLENKIRIYVDMRDEHKERNHRQDIEDIRFELKPIKFIWIGLGIILASQAFIGWLVSSVHH